MTSTGFTHPYDAFTFLPISAGSEQHLAKMCNEPNTVAVHVRRIRSAASCENSILLDGNTTLIRIKEPMCILFYMETMCI
jgi:hypothetical protein